MSVLRRLADARSTVEGKTLAVLMAAVLATSMCGMPAWADTKADASASPKATQADGGQAGKGSDAPANPVISLSLGNGYLVYGAGQIVKAPATKVTAVAGKDFKFVPEADKGYKVASVSYAGLDLYPTSTGEYVIPASKLVDGARLTLVTEKVSTATSAPSTTLSGQTSVPGQNPGAAVSEAVTQSGEITQQFAMSTLGEDPEPETPAGPAAPAKPQIIDNGVVKMEKNAALTLKSDRGDFAHAWTVSDREVALVSGERNVAIANGMELGDATITHTYAEYAEDGVKWQTRSEQWTVSVVEPQTLADTEGEPADEPAAAPADSAEDAKAPADASSGDPAEKPAAPSAPEQPASEPAEQDDLVDPGEPDDDFPMPKTYRVFTKYSYHVADGADATQLPEDIESQTLRAGDTYSPVAAPALSGYVTDYQPEPITIVDRDVTVNVVYHRDANGNGTPDCREFSAVVDIAGWTYGEHPRSPQPKVAISSLSEADQDDFGSANVSYKPKGAADDAWVEDRPVNAGEYTARAVWNTERFGQIVAVEDFTIAQRPVTLTSASEERAYDGTELRNAEVVVGGMGWANGEGASFEVQGAVTNVGSAENVFTYALNENTLAENYAISTVFGTLTVTQVAAEDPTLMVHAESAVKFYDGAPLTAGFSLENGVLAEGDWLDVTTAGEQTDAGASPNTITAWCVRNAAGDDVTANYNIAVSEAPGTLTVEPRPVTLTSASAYKLYDGQPLTNDAVTVGGRGWVEGQGASFEVTGGQTEIGSSANTFDYTLNEGTSASNYVITKVEGTLTVGNADAVHEVTVQAKSGSFTYDGTTQTVEGFETLQFVIDGATYDVEGLTARASAVDAGEYPVTVTGTPVVKDSEGDDVTHLFNVKTAPGTLSIAKRGVTLVSPDAEKAYDGTPLVSQTVQVKGDGWGFGDGATYRVTGSQTAVGSSANAFSYTLDAGTKADNYLISQIEGTLTVTPADAEHSIVLVPNTGSALYDGAEHTVEGFRVKGFEGTSFVVDGKTYTVSGVTIGATGVDAGTYEAKVSGTPVVTNATGNDVSASFAVTVEHGTALEIAKRTITLTSHDFSKQYDGTPLVNTNSMVSVGGDGWANITEGATYSFTGAQTLVGTSENFFTYELNASTKADNYRIITAYGKLTVLNRDAKYQATVAGASAETVYDGTEQVLTGLAGEQTYTLGEGEAAKEVKAVQVSAGGLTYYVAGLEARGAGKDVIAGGYPVNVTGSAIVYDAQGNNVTDQFAVTTTPGTLTIDKRPLTLRSADLKKNYDGTALTNGDAKLAVEDGWAAGEGASYQFSASITRSGTVTNDFAVTPNGNTNLGNYDLTIQAGTLEVANPGAQTLEVFGNSASFTYDGQAHAVSGFVGQDENGTITVRWGGEDGPVYRITGLPATAWYAEATNVALDQDGPASAAGTIAYEPDQVVVYDENGECVNDLIVVRPVAGKLTIEPRPITFTSASAEKPYDGTPLTSDAVEVGGEGFAGDEAVDFEVTGSQMLVGTSPNTFAYKAKDGSGFIESNYAVTKAEGSLTVTPADAEFAVELTRGSSTVTYDGQEHEAPDFEGERGTVTVPAKDGQDAHEVAGIWAQAQNGTRFLVNTDGYQAGTAKNAGTHFFGATGVAAVFDEAGNDVSDQVAVVVGGGALTIEKRPVTLASNIDAKVYDDEPLVGTSVVAVNDAEGEGWAEGEEGSYLFTSSQTNVGSVPNRFECVSNAATDLANYDVTMENGTLTVVPQSINPDDPTEINPDDLTQAVYTGATVEAPASPTYNGQAQELVPVVRAANGRVLRNGSDFTVSYASEPVNVGTASAIVSASAPSNYRGAVACEYEILPAPVRIIVNPSAKFFGDDDPQGYGSFAVEGLFGSDTLGNVTLSRIGDDEAAGTYAGVIDATVAQQNGNYVVEAIERGAFTIAPIEGNALLLQNVAGADGFTKTYDGRPAVIQARALQPDSEIWFSADGTLDNWTTDLPDFVNAGTYQVYVQATHNNFAPTQPVLATVTISPAIATIAVDNAAKVAGEADPEFTGTVTGLVAGDALEKLAYSRTGDDEAVGTYPDTLTATYYPNPNYSVRVVPGTFAITAPAAPLTASPLGGSTPTPGVAPDDGPLATVAGLLASPFETFIGNDETPLAETISDDDVPEAAFDHPVCWVHFYTFLGIVVTLIYGAACIVRRLRGARGVADLENDLTSSGRRPQRATRPTTAADRAEA